MTNKVLVLQTKIGTADFNNIQSPVMKDYFEFEQKVCIPSVKHWANKCGYDYKMITTSSINDDTFFHNIPHKYASERLMHLSQDEYDYIVYLDTDVFVAKHSPSFPLIPGLSSPTRDFNIDFFNKIYPDIPYTGQKHLNSGVFSVDKETGKKITKYFKDRLESGDNRNVEYADQDILNVWQFNNGINRLDRKWNYLLLHFHMLNINNCFEPKSNEMTSQNYDELKKANFVHFVGHSKLLFKFFYRMLK
jgi:hypothetical protein